MVASWIMPMLAGAACGLLAAQEVELPGADPIGWRPLTSIRLGAGYKDNVLLSSFVRDDAPFLGVAADAFLWRPVGDHTEFEGLLLGEHREFFGVEDLDREQMFFGLLQMRHGWNDNWRGAGAFEYLYQDQVLDVSATEAVVTRARVRGHSMGVRPSLRRALGGGWLELQLTGSRQLFGGLLDDYWQVAPRLAWEWPLQESTQIGVHYEWAYRWYDQDEQRTAAGAVIPGTRRVLTQQEAGFLVRHQWGEGGRLRLTGRAAGRLNRDEKSGFYDYVRPQISLRLRYRTGSWEWEAGGRLSHYAYRVQRVAQDDGARRRRLEMQVEFRVQRRLTETLLVFVDYAYERTVANRAVEEYWVNTAQGGIEWEF
jgi:hypothetical protein